MFFKELISQGWQALMRNRMRSVLTMLGIVWGLASVVILLAYGQGLGGGVLNAFMNMGNNVVVFWPGQTSMQAGGQRAGKKVAYEYEDVESVRDEVPLVRAVSAESCSDFGYKVGTRVVSIQTRGVEFPYGEMRKLDVGNGRYFSEGDFLDHRRVVILGYNAAKKANQGAPAVGQSVLIGGQSFEVIGTLRNKIQDSMYQGPDNEDGFIPFQVYRDLKQVRDPDMFIIQPQSAELHLKAVAAVREVIARRHHFDPRDDKAAPVWDSVESGEMIAAFSIGLQVRSLKIALVFAPLMITGYAIGLPYGPKGVAFAYSAVMTLWVIPHILWCVHGTAISFRDILLALSRPLASSMLAGGVAFGVRLTCGQFFPPLARLVLESSVLFVTFFGVLLFAAGQKSLYLDLLRGLKGQSPVAEKLSVSSARVEHS